MKKYWSYFCYVVRHKWFVLLECCKLGIPWRGLVHDLSKFRPSEFVPYANQIYGCFGNDGFIDTVLWHYKKNKHHWQYWCVLNAKGEVIAIEMPEIYIREMVADWKGMGRAMGNSSAVDYYKETYRMMTFHAKTGRRVRELLKIDLYGVSGAQLQADSEHGIGEGD